MTYLFIIFWILIFAVAYVYLIYPVLLFLLSLFCKDEKLELLNTDNLPTVTLFVTAYNEASFVQQKVENSMQLNYPPNKLHHIWVTDGTTDNTNDILKAYSNIKVYYEPARLGKINAMNRGVQFVNTDLIVFSDGNTLLGADTINEIVKLFQNQKVGCVAGEKRILLSKKDDAASAGEGLYWKYESFIKKLDAKLGSTIGAAGELFAIRTHLYAPIDSNIILDDFLISLKIAMQGYKIDYSPKAYAYEKASASVKEEMKRKVRIAAGSIQALTKLTGLLNIFRYKFLSFQFISHKVLRWVLVPISLPILVVLNLIIIQTLGWLSLNVYIILGFLQLLFYILVLIGNVLQNKNTKHKWIFVPYYFYMANYAMWAGFFKFIRGKQSVNWERAQRAS